MKFDIPGPHPRKVVLYRDNKERVYDLPFDATDPVDIEILTAEGLQVEKPKPVATSAEPEPAPKSRPSRKEVEPE